VRTDPNTANTPSPAPLSERGYEPPALEVISLDCEITSYAPDDRPLF